MPHILIVGAGSVGKRHAVNLGALGCSTAAMDPREDRRGEFADAAQGAETFSTLDKALATGRFDGAVVCSPTAFHVDQCLALLDAGVPILLEKPVAKDLGAAERLAAALAGARVPLMLGYTWRWWPPLARLRELLAQRVLGRLHHVDFFMSAHLADWHPYEPLADFFMSDAALGGGALLDESHWLDLMVWMFGQPQSLYAHVETIGGLDITSDDNVDMLITYADNLRARVHLDLYGRPHRKEIRFIGEKGSMVWSEAPNRIAICHDAGGDWQEEKFDNERNDMFMGVAREFVDMLNGVPATTCSLDDGIAVMRLIEAARRSAAEGRRIEIARGA